MPCSRMLKGSLTAKSNSSCERCRPMPRFSLRSERKGAWRRWEALCELGDRSSVAVSAPLPTAAARWPLRPVLGRELLLTPVLLTLDAVFDAVAACLARS